ncbi:MAG: lipoyl(octanoyl) transferase LipB [Firmicutes bacterium]|nr:lipoyl(octanoyl) transferase LipB [Bacillota bacterium]
MVDSGFSSPRPAQFRRLGPVFYEAGLRMQKSLASDVEAGSLPDQILILEHPPVFTLGRNATRRDIHVNDAFLRERGVGVFETDRGGQVTYHGPGQVVVYPLCNLGDGRKDLGRFVRGLEEVMIRTAGDFGVKAHRLEGFPGVWVETERGWEKLGALGIHLKRWLSTHGIAFNVNPGLHHFRWITPCGITDKGVCSLASLLGDAAPTWEEAALSLERHLTEVLAYEPQTVEESTHSVSALTWRQGASGPEVLMMLRQPQHGLWWSSVTGRLEPGETAEEAAHRELREETGLTGKLGPLEFRHTFWVDPAVLGLPPGPPRFNCELCYLMEVPPGSVVDLALDEHSECRWCSPDEAVALARWEGTQAAIRHLERRWADLEKEE